MISTLTRAELTEELNRRISVTEKYPDLETAQIDAIICKMALAAMDSEPVILYRERNPYNGLTTGWQELTENEFSFIKENAGENAEFLTLYRHAQPAPVVPAVSDDIGEIRVGRLPTMNQDDYPGLGDWWVQLRIGEDSDEVLARVYGATPQEANNRAEALACRAAMLQASPVCTCPSGDGSLRWPCPVHPGSSPVIPDTWIPVSERMPDENAEQQVLACFKGGDISTLYYFEGRWDDAYGIVPIRQDVTHWMPLPAAPQEGK
ncbi:DUF551 domain-containing protein [Klebsiella pneumoniae]|uniref:DUF551 domain-containing protein n=1 Tax=Klebsiella pneumoniae TaxID=573 RepID=UPI001F4CB6C8|nr:DUF551 domain-containing protein [Klebsiella pneumoniae]MCH8361659.1 DUF551 domain-containing protein [Klebsiella pneumoniae]